MSRYHKPTAQPKKSGWRHVDIGLPFPNFALGKTEIPAVCRCVYDGRNFFVTNQLDMHTLHYNGAFGTSSLTFRGLSYERHSFAHRSYFKKKFTNAQNSATGSNGMVTEGSVFKFFNSGKGKRIRIDVESSNSGPGLCVQISQEPGTSPANATAFTEEKESCTNSCSNRQRTNSGMSVDEDTECSDAKNFSNHLDHENNGQCNRQNPKIDSHLMEEEKLILMPEEAIFLSFGVGCLAIYNLQGDAVDYRQCWKNLVTINPNFPTHYAAYHYYRGKNWVPKDGHNYGASYVLYEGGPQVNHGTYVVHILESSKPKPTWMELAAWQRLANHVSKHLLLCEVSVPKEFRPEVSEPRSVFDMKLNEMSLCRWLPRVDSQDN